MPDLILVALVALAAMLILWLLGLRPNHAGGWAILVVLALFFGSLAAIGRQILNASPPDSASDTRESLYDDYDDARADRGRLR